MGKIIKSVNVCQSDIIKDIISLYVKCGKIDCDSTYSIGKFYDNTGVEQPMFKFDINPQKEFVEKADATQLPLENESISCLMFDPPFLATTGKSLKDETENNVINKRFGVYPNEKLLHKFYYDALKEGYRVLKYNGIMIFKCQDKVSSGKQYMSHVYIINKAIDVGFYPIDLFVLIAKNRLIANWQRNQKHARKFHSYFLVLKKCNIKIEYT